LIGEAAPALEIIRRPEDVKGFVLLPRRWVDERSFAWFQPVPKIRVWMPPVMQEGNWLWLVLLSAVVCPAF